MPHEFTTSYLKDSLAILRQYKAWGDRALAQLNDEEIARQLDEDSNSIAQIVKHLVGNMRSRWTDFLTTDGEKPDRNRDSEFVQPPATKAATLELWESGWRTVFDALELLGDEDVNRTVVIRGEPHSVMQAIQRQVGHYALHIGQIILLAKHFRGTNWKTLTIPKNRSAEFHAKVLRGEASQR